MDGMTEEKVKGKRQRSRLRVALLVAFLFLLLALVAQMSLGKDFHRSTKTSTSIPSSSAVLGKSTGSSSWVHTWGTDGDDYAEGLALDSTGNLFVAGTGWKAAGSLLDELLGVESGDECIFLSKYSSEGTLLWNRAHVGNFRGVSTSANGNIFVTGYARNESTYADILVLGYAPNGNPLLQRTWDSGGDDFGHGVLVTSNGCVYVAGSWRNPRTSSVDALLLKFALDGALLWQKTWGGSDEEYFKSLLISDEGNILVAGTTFSYGAGSSDVLLVEYTPDGAIVGAKTWGGQWGDAAQGLCVDDSGNIYIVGFTCSYRHGQWDVFLLKYRLDLTLEWQRSWGTDEDDQIWAVSVERHGNVILGGDTWNPTNKGLDLLLLEYSPAGSLLQQKTWDGDGWEGAQGLALASSGCIYIAGFAATTSGSWHDANGVAMTPTGTETVPDGHTGSANGTLRAISDAPIRLKGVRHGGDGKKDVLIMKADPSLLE